MKNIYKVNEEAVKKIAERVYDNGSTVINRNDLEEMFPELKKESEDERIKEKIIATIHLYYGEPLEDEAKEMIAWLEKQGEQKPVPDWMPKFLDELRSKKNYFDWEEHKDIEGGILAIINWMNPNYFNEKDGKQKTDKVEPKFKNGQWIVWQDKCYKVNDSGYGYELDDQNGLGTSVEYGTIDENAHLWDITEDAKDGDVLVYRDGQWIFIYKEKIDDKSFYYHALYSTIQGLTIANVGFTLLSDAITPATKEQRELLFQKMKESGYEWNDNKKELKKIEGESTWSEEDEKHLNRAINILDISKAYTTSPDRYENTINWLKFIKDRVQPQPKQEWTAEDEEELKIALNTLEEAGQYSSAKWLKNVCLVPQTMQKSWSEEDETIAKALTKAANNTVLYGYIGKSKLLDWFKSLKYRVGCEADCTTVMSR